MNSNDKTMLNNQLNAIARAVKLAKAALQDGTATELYTQLKSIHNTTTKAKNQVVDVALLSLDKIGEVA